MNYNNAIRKFIGGLAILFCSIFTTSILASVGTVYEETTTVAEIDQFCSEVDCISFEYFTQNGIVMVIITYEPYTGEPKRKIVLTNTESTGTKTDADP